MTGLHTGHGSLRGNDELSLRPQDVTVAEVLKKAGYRTGHDRQVGHRPSRHRRRAPQEGLRLLLRLPEQPPRPQLLPDASSGATKPASRCKNVVPDERPERRRHLQQQGPIQQRPVRGRSAEVPRPAQGRAATRRRPATLLPLPAVHDPARQRRGRQAGHGGAGPGRSTPTPTGPSPRRATPRWSPASTATSAASPAGSRTCSLDDHTLVVFTSDNGPHREGGSRPDVLRLLRPPARHQARPVRRRHPRAVPRPLARPHARRHLPATSSAPSRTSSPPPPTWPASPPPPSPGPTASASSPRSSATPRGRSSTSTCTGSSTKARPPRRVRMGDWKAIRKPMQTGKVELFDLKSGLGREARRGGGAPGGGEEGGRGDGRGARAVGPHQAAGRRRKPAAEGGKAGGVGLRDYTISPANAGFPRPKAATKRPYGTVSKSLSEYPSFSPGAGWRTFRRGGKPHSGYSDRF